MNERLLPVKSCSWRLLYNPSCSLTSFAGWLTSPCDGLAAVDSGEYCDETLGTEMLLCGQDLVRHYPPSSSPTAMASTLKSYLPFCRQDTSVSLLGFLSATLKQSPDKHSVSCSSPRPFAWIVSMFLRWWGWGGGGYLPPVLFFSSYAFQSRRCSPKVLRHLHISTRERRAKHRQREKLCE